MYSRLQIQGFGLSPFVASQKFGSSKKFSLDGITCYSSRASKIISWLRISLAIDLIQPLSNSTDCNVCFSILCSHQLMEVQQQRATLNIIYGFAPIFNSSLVNDWFYYARNSASHSPEHFLKVSNADTSTTDLSYHKRSLSLHNFTTSKVKRESSSLSIV